VLLSSVPRRGDAGSTGIKEIIEGFVLLRRGENPSLVLDGVHAKVDELNGKILPRGMKIEVFLRPLDPGRATRSAPSTTTCCSRSPDPRRGLAVPAHDRAL